MRTGTGANDKIAYGLTTDVSASEYSPAINVSGRTMYIARQSTVTTDTVYHTATRESTSGVKESFVFNHKKSTVTFTSSRKDTRFKTFAALVGASCRAFSLLPGCTATSNVYAGKTEPNTTLITDEGWYGVIPGGASFIISRSFNADKNTIISYAIDPRFKSNVRTEWLYTDDNAPIKLGTYQSRSTLLLNSSVTKSSYTDTMYVTTNVRVNGSTYDTCESTYTSRTEYLTAITNNVYTG